MVYRNRSEIVQQILTTLTVGTKRTHLMYAVRLSYTQLEFYIKFLEGKGLIYKKAGMLYDTTAGREYLKALNNVPVI